TNVASLVMFIAFIAMVFSMGDTGEIPTPTDLDDLDSEVDGDDLWEVYELVVRRYFATLAPAAKWERLRIDLEAGDDETTVQLKANGRRLLEPGYHTVY
ncbi:MAG: DNA topoisomerase, partial [Haloferacaceae archaeon]|nr:DNA topoisomerase [Haloferacaceae archaeon]